MILGRKEKKVIESTYFEKADIKRHVSYKTEWNETRTGLSTIYESIKCAISQNARRNVTQTESRNEIEYDVKMFCSPNIEIKPGDVVEATFENGLTRNYKAGEPFPYPYHQEVPLIREDEA